MKKRKKPDFRNVTIINRTQKRLCEMHGACLACSDLFADCCGRTLPEWKKVLAADAKSPTEIVDGFCFKVLWWESTREILK